MWILPKQLLTSAYAVDTQASGLDSKEFCQLCEKSLMWRSKPTQSQTWLRRWKSLPYLQPLSSRTLKPSHSQAFVDVWTSSLVGSRASRSALLGSEKPLKTPATSSPTLKTESDYVDLDWFSLKTSKESSQQKLESGKVFSNMSSESWKAWVTQQRQEYLARAKSAQATREKESSSLLWRTPATSESGTTLVGEIGKRLYDPKTGRNAQYGLSQQVQWATPNASDHKGPNLSDGKSQSTNSLPTQVVKQWPTPNTLDHMGQRSPEALQRQFETTRKGRTAPSNLRESVFPANWPTPTARDYKGANSPEGLTRKDGKSRLDTLPNVAQYQSQDQEKNNLHMKNHELNPSWVEQLMCMSIGWTALGCLEMVSFPQPQSSPLESLERD